MPVKPLVRAKSRLKGVLSSEQRERLALGMLLRNIQIMKMIPAISGTLVISRDTKVLAVARDQEVHTVQESGQPELNSALSRATKLLRAWGADATLILPTDIPLLMPEDIEQIVHLGRFPGTVVIAPDHLEDGTNALLVNPPGAIKYGYGEGSFARHKSHAELEGLTLHVYESERIAIDVDTPEDLKSYAKLAEKYNIPLIDYLSLEPAIEDMLLVENPSG
ncbi:MAG: 2-phospho-L-lactate guanylyltransferase [Chloroflexi bacterium]|nr:2-phospho-L-lactate guanylyltransferase [Chloroflexota bacterium]